MRNTWFACLGWAPSRSPVADKVVLSGNRELLASGTLSPRSPLALARLIADGRHAVQKFSDTLIPKISLYELLPTLNVQEMIVEDSISDKRPSKATLFLSSFPVLKICNPFACKM